MNDVWVIMSCQQVADHLKFLIDRGQLAEANALSYKLNAFMEKIKAFVQSKGGHLSINLYERQIMQIPISAADELPLVVEDYQEQFHYALAVGIGLSTYEAAKAAERSATTGQIELYEPEKYKPGIEDDSGVEEVDLERSGTDGLPADPHNFTLEFPANVYDPVRPRQPKHEPKSKPVMRPDAATEMQLEQQMMQAQMQQMMPQQDQMAQQQEAYQPQDLLEALNGGPVDGHAPVSEEDEENPKKKTKSSDDSDSSDESGTESDEDAEELKEEVDEAADETSNKKLADALAQVSDKIPQIMGLAESNPEAFKQTIDMINKLIGLAKQSKKVSKSEAGTIETIEKAFRRGQARFKGRSHVRYPVGTRLGRKKKVLVDGKEVWRSMASGQVKDNKGAGISVRSSNLQAEGKGRGNG